MDVVAELALGRQAFEERAWATAYERLAGVEPSALGEPDRLALATAAFLSGDREAADRAYQESYRHHIDAGSTLAAARDTFWLGMLHNMSGNPAVGGGWVARGARLLQDAPSDAVEHGYQAVHEMFRHIFAGEFPAALEVSVRIAETGRRCREANLVALGLSAQGRLLIYGGRVPEGLALLDEAMVGLNDPDVSPVIAGHVYCSMVEGCQEIADYRRMTEWTTLLTRWCQVQPDLVPFTGQCAVHRAQIMRWRGALPEALEELPAGPRAVRRRGRHARSRSRALRAGRGAARPGRLRRRGGGLRGGSGTRTRPAAGAGSPGAGQGDASRRPWRWCVG